MAFIVYLSAYLQAVILCVFFTMRVSRHFYLVFSFFLSLIHFTCLFSLVILYCIMVPNIGNHKRRVMLSDSEEQELKDLLLHATNPSSAAMIIISLLFRIVVLLKKED